MKEKFDTLDSSIIRALEQRGRTSNRQISRLLGVSEATVRTRVKRLQQEGLLRVIAVRNLDQGFALAHCGILVEPGKLQSTARAVAAMPEVVFCAVAIGHYDVVAMVLAESRTTLMEVVNDRLALLPGVRRVESTETLRSLKFEPNLRKLR